MQQLTVILYCIPVLSYLVLSWNHTFNVIAAMNINVGVRTAAALLDQFYEKRRLLIISAPTAANHNYRFQMTNLQVRHDIRKCETRVESRSEELMEVKTPLSLHCCSVWQGVCFLLSCRSGAMQ